MKEILRKMKKCTCGRRLEELTEREKRSIIKGLIDPDNDDDHQIDEISLSEGGIMSVTSVLHFMRDINWDLWTACDYLRMRLRFLEKDNIKHGSVQNIIERTCAALVYYYNVPIECFYDWDT